MSAACSFLLICPFKGSMLLNKGRQAVLKDGELCLPISSRLITTRIEGYLCHRHAGNYLFSV